MGRLSVFLVVLSGCAALPPDGEAVGSLELDGDATVLTHCMRVVELGAAPVDDVSRLDLGSQDVTVSAAWRGVDRWYPVTVPGTMTTVDADIGCSLTVDLGPGVWIVDGTCGGLPVHAEASRCRSF